MPPSIEKRQERGALIVTAERIVAAAVSAKRALTADENGNVTRLLSEAAALMDQINSIEKANADEARAAVQGDFGAY